MKVEYLYPRGVLGAVSVLQQFPMRRGPDPLVSHLLRRRENKGVARTPDEKEIESPRKRLVESSALTKFLGNVVLPGYNVLCEKGIEKRWPRLLRARPFLMLRQFPMRKCPKTLSVSPGLPYDNP